MRRYLGDQNYAVEVIGTSDDNLDADGEEVLTFSQAQNKARGLFIQARRRAAGLPEDAGPYTVQKAVEEYLVWLEQSRKSAKDSRSRAEALIYPILGSVECAKLTNVQIRNWRDGVAKAPPRLRTQKGKEQKFKEVDLDDPEEIRRRQASTNRVLTILKAALNHAWREHKIASDDAWRRVQPFKEADAARVRYLTLAEAKRLINAAQGSFRPLVQLALLTGCRFGELAALRVADFNPDSGTLHIRTSKSGKGRHVVLTEEGVALSKALTLGKASTDLLLTRDGGEPWKKSTQTRPMDEACKAAKIAPAIGFHILRHTYASLSIMNGAPLLVVARNLGHADTRMVEKHYGHLSATYMAEAVRAAAPRFGMERGNNITRIEDVA
ncbi:Site-specific recombinase XerD [Acidocella aminolytica 101 = DSM 11237]|nr:Site-specific recombinase XerD [Acidocella aminolytica 101 = DSM 11237]